MDVFICQHYLKSPVEDKICFKNANKPSMIIFLD